MNNSPLIRSATSADANQIWNILEPIFRAGDTYAIAPDISRADALSYWMAPAHSVFVAEDEGSILGTYYLKPNQGGGGSHVCNCAFATSSAAQGRGIARAMLEHGIKEAKTAGFLAMQFNFVVSTNIRAVDIWKKHGFDVVGTLPRAFHHPNSGFVDVLVMYRWL